MNIILLGAPGAGKGTQAEFICKRYDVPAISTGNIIRDALNSGSELGNKMKSYMDTGDLVPNEIVIELVKNRIALDDCKNGFILDGFPRTITQAEALDKMDVIIDKVVDIEVDDHVITKRISGRRICENCGKSYHMIFRKPKVDNVCDDCSGTLVQRKDDTEETVRQRLEVYHEETEPLKKYYAKQNKLLIIDGTLSISDISEKIVYGLEAK